MPPASTQRCSISQGRPNGNNAPMSTCIVATCLMAENHKATRHISDTPQGNSTPKPASRRTLVLAVRHTAACLMATHQMVVCILAACPHATRHMTTCHGNILHGITSHEKMAHGRTSQSNMPYGNTPHGNISMATRFIITHHLGNTLNCSMHKLHNTWKPDTLQPASWHMHAYQLVHSYVAM